MCTSCEKENKQDMHIAINNAVQIDKKVETQLQLKETKKCGN